MTIFTDSKCQLGFFCLEEFRNENESENESDTKKLTVVVKGSLMQNIKERFLRRRKHHLSVS